jgi:hypothetical protein
MQSAAMNSNFRIRVPGSTPPRLLVYHLSEPVKESARLIHDAVLFEFCLQTESGKLSHRVGEECYSDTELLNCRRSFVDRARNPSLVQI